MKFLYLLGAMVFSLFISGKLTAQNSVGVSKSSRDFKKVEAENKANILARKSSSTAHWKTTTSKPELVVTFNYPGFENVVNEINTLETEKKSGNKSNIERQLSNAYAKFKAMLEKELTKGNLSTTSKVAIQNELNKLNK
jgi:hypothetical protein